MSSDSYVPASAMVIAAHPDDVEFTCAGTLALWARGGARLCYVLCTSGEAGIETPGVTRERAAEIREAEQQAAAAVVGAEVVFLRETDGMLQPTLELRKRLIREIRRFRPEVVICGDPTVVWMGPTFLNHPDHRAAASAAMDAAWPAAGQPSLCSELEQEGITAHRPRKLYVTGWAQPGADVWVDIGETLEAKCEALRAHASQMSGSDPGPFIRNWAAGNAQGKGMEYAECFRVVTLVSDEVWERTRGRRGEAA
jgi:LmbE family N-acetylglucosaminyl deacetylase